MNDKIDKNNYISVHALKYIPHSIIAGFFMLEYNNLGTIFSSINRPSRRNGLVIYNAMMYTDIKDYRGLLINVMPEPKILLDIVLDSVRPFFRTNEVIYNEAKSILIFTSGAIIKFEENEQFNNLEFEDDTKYNFIGLNGYVNNNVCLKKEHALYFKNRFNSKRKGKLIPSVIVCDNYWYAYRYYKI